MVAYEWIKKNILQDGYCIERSNDIAGWNLEEDMLLNGFIIDKKILNGSYLLFKKI